MAQDQKKLWENEPLTIMHLDLKSEEAKFWGTASLENPFQQ